MDFRWPDEYLAFRDEVDAFIQEWRTPELAKEIREREDALKPVGERYNERLDEAKVAIQDSNSETAAAGALVDYVEAYAARWTPLNRAGQPEDIAKLMLYR